MYAIRSYYGESDCEGTEGEPGGDHPGSADRKLPCRDRTEPLLRVGPVQFDVVEIVDEVAGAGYRTKSGEGQQRLADCPGIVHLAGKEQPGENP